MKKKQDTSWEGVSGWYDSLLSGGDTYQEKVIAPNLARILGKLDGARVLDIACGQGYFSALALSLGGKVTGVDISKTLIATAREKIGDKAKFYIGSAEQLQFAQDASTDVCFIVLALQNIEHPEKVIAECARVLQKGGRLILVLNHPAFRVPQHSDWGFDMATGEQYRTVSRYMSETRIAIDMHPGDTKKKDKTVSFHFPLQYFFKLFAKNGLYVARLEEWISHKKSGTGPRQKAEDAARKEIPMFLCLEIKKV